MHIKSINNVNKYILASLYEFLVSEKQNKIKYLPVSTIVYQCLVCLGCLVYLQEIKQNRSDYGQVKIVRKTIVDKGCLTNFKTLSILKDQTFTRAW